MKPVIVSQREVQMSVSVSQVFDTNAKVKGSSSEPDWNDHLGYSYRGQPVSQRDISRLVSHNQTLLRPRAA
jgi:hypothetical protein